MKRTIFTPITSPYWLANKIIAAHTLLSMIAFGWAWMVRQPLVAVLIFILWLLALIIYSEWRNGC